MKLRLNHNSIRLRLNQTEVQMIANGDPVVQNLSIDNTDIFSYGLYQSQDYEQVTTAKHEFGLAIYLPATQAERWSNSEEVGIYQEIPLMNDEMLSISIEKDFQCLHKRPGEDESDNFPHHRA